MKKAIPVLLAALAASCGAAGCESNSYSEAIRYVVRTDPLVLDKNLGEERFEPDRPGVLPLFSAKDLDEPVNPMFPNRASLFKQNKLRDPMSIHRQDRRDIEATLVSLFGTPARPHVRVNPDIIESLKVDRETLERGSSLYRVHCLHCHGVTGDGRGPTGRWVNPHPRDYRQGLFKFMSVDQRDGSRPPRRDDLYRVLQHGVEGTAMPSFALLAAADLDDLVSYVIHLSIRGRVEYDTIVNAFSYDAEKNTLSVNPEQPLDEVMGNYLDKTAKDWHESQSKDKAIAVAAYPYDDGDMKQLKDSVVRGFRLFKGEGEDKPGPTSVSKEDAKAANCVSCHKDFGRQALYKFDEWGTLTKPRDLTQGVFRGGRRPVDVYYRIHSGIQPSGMTSFGKVIANPDRLWDLVNFVKILPYPAMRKTMGIVLD